MADIKHWYRSAGKQYAKLNRQCEGQVVRWRWATGSMFELQPFYFERNRFKRGRWLKSEPKRKKGQYLYGYDDQDNVVIVRQYVKPPRQFYAIFYLYRNGTVESVRFDYAKKRSPLTVSRCLYRRGRIASYELYGWGGHTKEQYEYDDDRIVRIRSWYREFYGDLSSKVKAIQTTLTITYDELDRLAQIDEVYPAGSSDYPQGGTETLYRRPRKGETVKELCGLVEERLVELIPEVVAAAKIRKSAYCLLLVYDWENPDLMLPPDLAVGLASDRSAAAKQHGKDAKYYLWNPAEFAIFGEELELDDRRLAKACELLGQQLAMKDRFTPALKLLNNVAARLMEHDWSGKLKTTEDFVVAAVDLEAQDHLMKNLRKSVSPEAIADLKRKGYL